MGNKDFNRELLEFIQSSPTPFHAVSQMCEELGAAGFSQLNESEQWDVGPGRYYVVRNGSSIVAFNVPAAGLDQSGLAMVGAHTDSPCLKVKPNPVINKNGYIQAGVEVYGGALLNPWFDRDLSLAGRVSYRDDEGVIRNLLINFIAPVAVIPSLAIHLDKLANEERKINAQTDIVPMLLQSVGEETPDFREILKTQIAKEHTDVDLHSILDYELFFYDSQPPVVSGLNDDFISAARLDNLLSCYVGMRALIDAVGDDGKDRACLLVCNDHEEVGSASACGAQGPFLKSVLERLVGNPESLARLIDRSLFISCDNAHGVHPNFSDRHDANHGPILNKGPAIKMNANQRYATNSETAARFRQVCIDAEVPVQDFVTRTDMGCGSTIGPITASEIGVRTVDVGVPQFAMHSIRETCGSKDPYYLYQALNHFYQNPAD